MTKIDFLIEQGGLIFSDSIVLPDDHGLIDAEIEAMKQARFDAWYQVVTAPASEPVEGEAE